MAENNNNYWPSFITDDTNNDRWDPSDKLFLIDQFNDVDSLLNNNSLTEQDLMDTHSSMTMDSHMLDMNHSDQKSRRKEQNRAAQRAFRERKDRYVKELQSKLNDVEKKYQAEILKLKEENDQLKSVIQTMESKIHVLQGAAIAFDVSISKMREVVDLPKTQTTGNTPPLLKNQQPTNVFNEDSFSPSWGNHSSPTSTSSLSHHEMNDDFINNNHYNDTSNRGHEHKSTVSLNDPMPEESFVESSINRFEHKVDPIVHSGIKMIPYSQIWGLLAEHPDFDERLMDDLCVELKKKARCSGTGPVIPESELEEVFKRLSSTS